MSELRKDEWFLSGGNGVITIAEVGSSKPITYLRPDQRAAAESIVTKHNASLPSPPSLAPQPAQPREVWDEVISLIPTSWLDPLLSGAKSALHGCAGKWGCPDIERLLQGIKARLEAARDTPPVEQPEDAP